MTEADRIDAAKAPLNAGRGVSCARTIVAFLRAGRHDLASACARNEYDKLRRHPQLVADLDEAGLLEDAFRGPAS